MPRTPYLTVFRTALVAVLAAMLSGCFVGSREFLTAADAEFPYKEITFSEIGQNESTTLVMRDGAYRSTDEDNPSSFLFKEVAPDTYVVQASGVEDGQKSILFAMLKMDRDADVVRAYKAVAGDDEKAPGMTPCDEGLCFDELQTYVDYALKAIADGAKPDATYRILSTK